MSELDTQKTSTIVDETQTAQAQERITKQQQYSKETVEAIKHHIVEGNGKRPDGWLAENDLTVANGKTGKVYNGMNLLKLNLQNYSDNRWLTFEQVKELDGGIQRGEKGQVVEIASFTKIVKDNFGGYSKENLDTPIYKHYTMFNVKQTFGIDKEKLTKISPSYEKLSEEEKIQRGKRIEETLKNMGVNVQHTKEKTASYDVNLDTIIMPEKDSISSEQYYGALLNQAAKATAHHSRVGDRDITAAYGTKEYAKEALITEIASMTMSKEYGVRINANLDKDFQKETNIKAIKGWIQEGKLDDKDIKDATFKALKSQRFILKHTPKLEQVVKKEIAAPAPVVEKQQEKSRGKGR